MPVASCLSQLSLADPPFQPEHWRTMHLHNAAILLYILANEKRYFATAPAARAALLAAARRLGAIQPLPPRRLFVPLLALRQVARGAHTAASVPRAEHRGLPARWKPSRVEALVVHALRRQQLSLRAVEELLRVPRETMRRNSGNAVDAVLADPAAFSAEALLALLQPPAAKPPVPKRKASPALLQTVEDVVKKTPCATLAHIRSVVVQRHPGLGNVSTSSICRWVKHKLRLSLKKPTFRAAATLLKPRTLARRNDFPARFHDPATAPLDKDGNVSYEKDDVRKWRLRPEFDRRFFHHLDDSGFNTHTGLRRRAWAPIGKQAHVMREASRSRNHSLIVVLGLQPRARHGVIASRWKPGGYPRAALISFLEEEYIPAVRAFRAALPADERERTIYLCMDNCSSHVSKEVEDAVADAGVEIVLIPPYSPVLNPCELVFSEVKRALRHDPLSDVDMCAPLPDRCARLYRRVMSKTRSVSLNNVDGYFRCCGWNNKQASL